jgi:hypothetical protein
LNDLGQQSFSMPTDWKGGYKGSSCSLRGNPFFN